VAYLLKAKTVEPKEQLLLVNAYEITFFSRQWLGKHIPMATDMHAIIEVLFSTWSVQGVIRKIIGSTKSVMHGWL
jgi:hypothetical protein